MWRAGAGECKLNDIGRETNTLISDMTTVIYLDDFHSNDRAGRKVSGESGVGGMRCRRPAATARPRPALACCSAVAVAGGRAHTLVLQRTRHARRGPVGAAIEVSGRWQG